MYRRTSIQTIWTLKLTVVFTITQKWNNKTSPYFLFYRSKTFLKFRHRPTRCIFKWNPKLVSKKEWEKSTAVPKHKLIDVITKNSKPRWLISWTIAKIVSPTTQAELLLPKCQVSSPKLQMTPLTLIQNRIKLCQRTRTKFSKHWKKPKFNQPVIMSAWAVPRFKRVQEKESRDSRPKSKKTCVLKPSKRPQNQLGFQNRRRLRCRSIRRESTSKARAIPRFNQTVLHAHTCSKTVNRSSSSMPSGTNARTSTPRAFCSWPSS